MVTEETHYKVIGNKKKTADFTSNTVTVVEILGHVFESHFRQIN